MVKKAIIYHHLGLGDHFTCNALVHHIAKDYDKVYVACKRRNEHTVKHMYEDYPNINIFEVDKEPDDIFDFSTISEIPVIKIGFEHTDPFNFEESFYKQFGLTLDNKNSEFKLPTNLSKSILYYLNVSNEFPNDFIFVHDESTAGKYNLNIESDLDRFIVEKEDTNDIFDYVHTICAAKEIHFINSGLFPLIVLLYHRNMLQAEKIYYHNIRKFHEGGHPIVIPENFITVRY